MLVLNSSKLNSPELLYSETTKEFYVSDSQGINKVDKEVTLKMLEGRFSSHDCRQVKNWQDMSVNIGQYKTTLKNLIDFRQQVAAEFCDKSVMVPLEYDIRQDLNTDF